MMNPWSRVPNLANRTLTNTRLRCARIFLKWVSVLITKSVNLLMESTNFVKKQINPNLAIELESANLFGNLESVNTDLDASFLIIKSKKQMKSYF